MPIGRSLGAMQASATRLITKWGGPASLIREGVKRDCIAAIGSYSPRERALVHEDAVRILIKAPLILPPDHKLDEIEFPKNSGKLYRIRVKPSGLASDGKTWIKYDCECLDGG